jgi:glyoxylase-like metal-dependent hydrolase (beta-lactamase superfamily II)
LETHDDGELRLIRFGPLGAFANNAYVIGDFYSKEAVLVDMPSGSGEVVTAIETEKWRVKAILLTHSHPDHWADYDLVREFIDAPVMANPAEQIIPGEKVDLPLEDNQEMTIGPFVLRAMHTPGHTPGSTCLAVRRFLLSGDVLFPGGPGRTQTPADLQETIKSITTRLYALPDATEVFPGHGDGTTIGKSKQEYAAFAARQHPADLCGDVTWAG